MGLAGVAKSLQLLLPADALVNTSVNASVLALDRYGNTATGFAGTAVISSTFGPSFSIPFLGGHAHAQLVTTRAQTGLINVEAAALSPASGSLVFFPGA